MTTATTCRDCGAPSETARCSRCALALILRVTTLDRIAADYCAEINANPDTLRHDPADIATGMEYGIAMALAQPEWAAALLTEQMCPNGESLADVIGWMAGDWPRRFPVEVQG